MSAEAAAAAPPNIAFPGPSCDWAQTHPSTDYWYYRRNSCMIRRTYVALVDQVSEQELARSTFTLRLYSYMGEGVDFATQLEIYDVVHSNPRMAGTVVSPSVICQESCGNPGVATPANQPLSPGIKVTARAFYGTTISAPNSLTFTTMIWGLQFNIPGAVPSPVYYSEFNPWVPWIRCDNLTPGLSRIGCVVWAYTPYMQYSLTGPRPELARHISDAQASGLPGRPGTQPLTRLWTGDDSADNRNTACPSSYTRPAGKSCDEYPFATSRQGADTGGGTGRTFSWCQIRQLPQNVTGSSGYSACMIDASQNTDGGNDLKNFYMSNRVHQDDPFWVQINP